MAVSDLILPLSFDAEAARRGFKYEDGPHLYWLDGGLIPSCSAILEGSGIKPRATNEVHLANMERRGKLGKRIHLFTRWLDENDLDWGDVKDEEMGFITGWQKFRKERNFIPDREWAEKPIFHPDLFYGVTPDDVGTIDGEPVIVEKKTSNHFDWHAIQTISQKRAIQRWRPGEYRRLVVRLTDWGSYLVREYKDDAIDWAVFRAGLTCKQWSVQHGG